MQLLSNVTNTIKGFFEKKKPTQKYFLALLFKERGIKAVVWEEKDGQVSVIDSGYVPVESALDGIPDEKLLELCDQAIGIAEKTLPPNVKTTQVIFGLNDWWVEGNTIKEPFMGKIKKVSKALELTPLGFVVFSEAVAHMLKIEEGSPPTVLLVGVGLDTLGVTLVRSGRIEASKTIVKEDKSDSEMAVSLIKSFGDIEILPSRFVLFDGEVSLEEAKQEFLAFPWTKELSFLHFPKIDILPSDFDGKAVVFGAAKEMGLSFEETIAEPVDETAEHIASDNATAFGFVKDQDIVDEALGERRLEEDEEEEKEEPKPEPTKQHAPIGMPKVSMPPLKLPSFNFEGVFAFFGNMRHHIPTKGFAIPLGIIVVFFLVLLAIFLLIPKATVVLAVQTRTLENEVPITLDATATSVNKDKRAIPAENVGLTLEGEKSQPTSGKKTVGENAKGEVTIYNKTENRKTFPKGTILTGPDTLRFTLDDEVTVASTAAFELSPSSTKAKITAAQIGEESNVGANTNFPFKDFPTSSYFAKNEAPLSGGTKKEVVVVSKEDQEKLLADLLAELKTKAKDELLSKGEGGRIVDIGMKEDITTKAFNKNVDDEADNLSLKLAVSLSTLSYKDGDLLEIIGSEIEKDVPAGFTFSKDTFTTSVKGAGKEKGTLIMQYKATLLPKLDIDIIKNDIAGKSKAAVEAYLKTLPVESFSITQNVEFPSPFNLLPQRSDNIVIEVKSN